MFGVELNPIERTLVNKRLSALPEPHVETTTMKTQFWTYFYI